MYADAAGGQSTVYVRATFLREPHTGLRMFISREVFQPLAEAGLVRAENIHKPLRTRRCLQRRKRTDHLSTRPE
jgi:hypothetical protein